MGAEEATGNSEDFCHMPWLAKKGVPPIMTLFGKISKSMERKVEFVTKKCSNDFFWTRQKLITKTAVMNYSLKFC